MKQKYKSFFFWPLLLFSIVCLWLLVESLYIAVTSESSQFWADALIYALLCGLSFKIANGLAAEEFPAKQVENNAGELPTDSGPENNVSKTLARRFISVPPFNDKLGITERLERKFKVDPRITSFESNSGYQYTTGESSGNMAEAAAEGQLELTYYSIGVKEEFFDEVKREHDAIINAIEEKP